MINVNILKSVDLIEILILLFYATLINHWYGPFGTLFICGSTFLVYMILKDCVYRVLLDQTKKDIDLLRKNIDMEIAKLEVDIANLRSKTREIGDKVDMEIK